MSDEVFRPGAFGRTGITPTVSLVGPLYVIQTTYIHPVTDVVTPLPAHHWVLGEVTKNTLVAFGEVSNPDGISALNVTNPGFGPFILIYVPAPAAARDYFVRNNEAWIDLDTRTWASPQPDRRKLERRNLYRIPAWTTQRKAARGGGFFEWPPEASPESKNTGRFELADLIGKPFGTLTRSWQIAIDHGWPRPKVRFRYFDLARGKENVVPPGLFVDAVPGNRSLGIPRLGSGTAVKDGDNTVRMMLEVDPVLWPGVHFQFGAPNADLLRVDLAVPEPAAGSKDTRLVDDAPIPTDPSTRNRLPNAWHSFQQRARLSAEAEATTTTWSLLALRLGSQSQLAPSVDFHLDDVRLVENDGTVTHLNGPPALFDHFMAILSPRANRPHLTDYEMDNSLLPAQQAYRLGAPTAAGRHRLHASTRLIHIEGMLFDLGDERVVGGFGATESLGARGAYRDAHPSVNYVEYRRHPTSPAERGNPYLEHEGMYEIHVIDAHGAQDPLSRLPLVHLFLLVTLRVRTNDRSAEAVDQFYKMLTVAAERWSQGSPGVPTFTKDYRVVAADPARRDRVLRVRAYFAEVSRGRDMINIKLGTGDRSSTEPSWWRVVNSPTLEYMEASMARDAAAAVVRRDSDGVDCARHTLAHEFGHVFGLPDEYAETLDVASVAPGAVGSPPNVPEHEQPGEGMPTDYRPFWNDESSIMRSNHMPRLRHYWHHVEALNSDSSFQDDVPGGPFVLRHHTLGGSGVDYVRPVPRVHPYVAAFAERAITDGHGTCALFSTGDDEGTAEAMFAPPGVRQRQPCQREPDSMA